MSTTGWPKPGDKMRFLGKNGYDFQREQALRVMTVGDVFTVHSISVGESSHSIVFREIGGNWNGVMFEWLNAPAASPSPTSPADDVAGLIDRAEQLAASLNRGSADIVLELAAALSRLQAREKDLSDALVGAREERDQCKRDAGAAEARLAEVTAELTTTEQLRHEENRRACSETEKRWASEADLTALTAARADIERLYEHLRSIRHEYETSGQLSGAMLYRTTALLGEQGK
jgi:hypothetical protein